jgi:acid stress chaperone HdeB
MNGKALAMAALAAGLLTVPARAQTIVDMSLVSCDQFMKSPKERRDVLSSWIGGYYSAMNNLPTIDARYVKRNSEKTTAYCKAGRKKTLMSAVESTWR